MFSGLVGLHPQTLQPVPDLAKAWTISEDGLTYTFSLRENLTWSDGTPITSDTVVASWKRLLTRRLLLNMLTKYFTSKMPKNSSKARCPLAMLVSATCDPLTVVVELSQVTPWFIELCAFQTLVPVPLHVIEEHGERWTRPEHIVTSGPFHLTEWKPRQQLVMEKAQVIGKPDKVTCKKSPPFLTMI